MIDKYYVYILWLKVAYTFSILGIFSIYDIKYRDIPDRHVWISLAISVALFGVSAPFYFSAYSEYLVVGYITLSMLFSAGLFTVMYMYGLIGKADVFIVSELALLYPLIDVYEFVYYETDLLLHLPPIILIVLYSTIISLLIALFKSLLISIRHRDKLPRDLPASKKILLLLIGRPMKVGEFLRAKHYYPLTLVEVSGGAVEKKHRLVFDVEEEDYSFYQEKYRELVESNYLSRDEYIWVTYGIPFLVPLLLGYALFLVVGDYPVIFLYSILGSQ